HAGLRGETPGVGRLSRPLVDSRPRLGPGLRSAVELSLERETGLGGARRGLCRLGLPAPPPLVLLVRVVGLFEGDRIAHEDQGHLAVLGLLGPLLYGTELADVVWLAERLLESRARLGIPGLGDDVLLARGAAARQ